MDLSGRGRHGAAADGGLPGEEGEAKAAEAEALETAGQTRQRLGFPTVAGNPREIYGGVLVKGKSLNEIVCFP